MVETPVLFETFVRVDYARQVWDAIKVAQPKTLYFYSNKGRADKEGEIERNNEIRSWVKEIDWECDLHTWFRDECVDVYTSLRGAISWLFENEERGIILEDDCVPTTAFFSFCDQMLKKFENNKKIWCVSGDNFVDDNFIHDDYFFSHYHYMYGWATWRDRWERINWNSDWNKESFQIRLFRELYKTKGQARFRVKKLNSITDFINKTKCWDYLFGYTIDINKGLTVHPNRHLVTNIGMIGVNHNGEQISPINKIANPISDVYSIKYHAKIIANQEVDYLLYRMFQHTSFIKRVISSLNYRIPKYYYKLIKDIAISK